MTDKLPVQDVLARLDADQDGALARLFALLRMPSISANPAHRADCRATAECLKADLESLGFTAALHDTPGQPVLLASHPGPALRADAPHVLFYGHYDVQPADPLELWESPPFEPVLRDGPHGPRISARGAVDDKGQLSMWLEAFRAWHAVTGTLPLRVTVLIEGEEEIGSPNLEAFLAAHRATLAADLAVVSDTNMWTIDAPAITTRLRGMVYAQIDLTCPSRDLHSGLYGGSALNPINVLTHILGGLHDAQGRVTLPGFYDGVRAVEAAQRAEWAGLGFNEAEFLGAIGLTQPAGEQGISALERLWARPTADINGIWGGYTGPGSKTVIASHAHAKVSFRLVPDQDPLAVAAALRCHVAASLPPGAHAEVQVFSTSPGIEVPADRPFIAAARAALAAEYGRPAVLIGSGGSIPVVESLRRLLGVDTLLMGFGLDDDQVHSPNEKFELRCFRQGARAHARLLAELAR